jgi:uncharacterized protein YfiM (DUF2279 family)
MAQDDRISDFPPADALTGAELYAAVQDGVTKKTTLPVMSVLQGTRVRETFRGFVSGSGTLLEQAAASINAGAQFTVQPNFLGIVTFVTNADQFATADSLVTKVSFIIKLGAGTYGSGGTTLTSGFLFQIAPINVEVDSDYYFELGNIGTSTIEDFVNGSGPYIVNGLSVFTATQNGDEKIWLFTGGDGTFGTGATPTTAGMFVDLSTQDIIPSSEYLQAITNSEATHTLEAVNLNRTTTFTVSTVITIPNSVFIDEVTTRQQAWLSFKDNWIINYPTTDGLATISGGAGALVYAERRELSNEWIVKRVDNISTATILGRLHNTVIGGVGATINTKALLAAQLTGVSEADISNFYLIGNDVYAQINKDYTATGNLGNALTKYIDYDGRFRVTFNSSNYFRPNITEWFVPNAVESQNLQIESNNSLTKFSANGVRNVTGTGFVDTSTLLELNLERLETISHNGANIFRGLSSLQRIYFPRLRSITATRSLAANVFTGINACTEIILPSLEIITDLGTATKTIFTSSGTLLTKFYAPNLKVISGMTGFTALNHAGCTITVHSDLSTSNNGQEHAALAAARAAGATIVYHQGDRVQRSTSTSGVLNLRNTMGLKQTSVINTSASFTIAANPVLGGNVKVLINRADEPKLPATQITLTGTGGTANITIAGVNYLATFNTDLTTTASDFVTSHAAAILAATGQVVTSSGAVISFLGFGDRVKIANATDDLQVR